MAVNVGSAIGYLDLDISGFMSGLKTAQTEANSASKNIATKLGNNMTSIGKKLTSAGSTLTKGITVPIVGVGTAAVKSGASFESAMSKVSAISGATGSDLQDLNKKAQEMGAKTKFSATESAEAFTYMAMAGWKTQDMLDGIDGIMSLAAADGLDLATTSDIVTDALTAFGLKAEDAGHFADVLAKASSSANTNVSMLGESFKYAAPVAGALGYSVEDVSIALGLMANAGIKGSQGGTALRASLSRLVKPTDQAAALMDKYHISLTNSDGSMKSLGEVMDMLRKNLGGLTEAEQAQVASTLFGQEAMSGMLAIINASDKDYKNLTKSIYDADGAADKMAKTMLDNLNGQITLLKSALEGLAIQISQVLFPYIKKFVKWLQDLVEKLQAMSKEEKEHIVKLAAFAAAIGPVLLVVGKLTTGIGNFITTIGKIPKAVDDVKGGIKNLVTGFKNIGEAIKLQKAGLTAFAADTSKLGAFLGGLTGPMIAVGAAIGVLVAAFVTLMKTNEDFRKKVHEIWDGVTSKINEAGKKITEALNSLGFNFKDIVEVISALWQGFCNLFGPMFIAVIDTIATTLSGIIDVVTGVIQVICGIIKGFKDGDWSVFLDGLQSLFMGFINLITAPFQGIFEGFVYILESFGTTWDAFWDGTVKFFKETWQGISNFFSDLWDGIVETLSGVWTSISTTVSDGWNLVTEAVSSGIETVKTFFVDGWNKIVEVVSGVWETIKNVVTVGLLLIKEIISAGIQIITLPWRFIWENCKDIIVSVWESIKTAVSDVINFVKDNIITPVMTAIEGVFNTVWGTISSFVSSTWNTISTTVSTAIGSVANVISTKLSEIKNFFAGIWKSISETVSSTLNRIKDTVTSAWNSVSTITSNVWNAISGVVSKVVNSIKETVTSIFNQIKSTVQSIMSTISGIMNNIWSGIKSTVSGAINAIKNGISTGLNAAKNTVTNILNGIKGTFTSTFNHIKSFLSGIVDWLKGIFNFKWSLPKIKLPHFKISGKFSLNPPSVPSFGIDWYKKAMNNGMILNSPTLFGYDPTSGKFLGGGEAGSETIVGTQSLLSMINQSVSNAIGGLAESLRISQTSTGDIVIPVYIGNEMLDTLVVKAIDRNNYRSGGR